MMRAVLFSLSLLFGVIHEEIQATQNSAAEVLMADVSPALVDELLAGQLDLMRLEAGIRARVLGLLDQLQRELVSRLANQNMTAFNRQRLNALLNQTAEAISTYYAKMQGELDLALQSMAELSAKHAAGIMETYFAGSVDMALPTDTFLARLASNALIMGAPSAEWWSRQETDTAFRFANAVRMGVAQGETNEQIVARVAGTSGFSGVMDVARSNARALVHTSIMEVAGEARRETFRQNSDVVEGIQQISTLDSHTTDICIAYSGAEFDLDGNPIGETQLPYDGGVPRHWGCRSIEVPITKTFAELGIDIPEPEPVDRASADGPVPADTTFDQFLERMGPEFQDETLGPGRAQLWRDGTITLQQLLDLRGNPLTLEELRAKYEGTTTPGTLADMFARIGEPDGGFTYQPLTGDEPTRGFAVSPYPDRSFAVALKDFSFEDLVAYAQRNADLFENADHYLGGWNDPASGKIFLDVSVVSRTAAAARQLALANDQIAYFDLSRGASVTVNRSASSGGVT
jgi:hypothetical protein